MRLMGGCLRKTRQELQAMMDKKAVINDIWDRFKNDLKDSINKHVPVKVIKPRTPNEPVWFNKKARKLVEKQRRVYNRYKKTGDIKVVEEYKAVRRENKRKLKDIEKGYMSDFLYRPLLNGNGKTFYSHMKKIRGGESGIK